MAMINYDAVVPGFCIVQIIAFTTVLISKRRSVRRIAAYLTTPIFFISYLLAVLSFCMQHSDVQFFDVIRNKNTSFFAVVNDFAEERWHH